VSETKNPIQPYSNKPFTAISRLSLNLSSQSPLLYDGNRLEFGGACIINPLP